MINIINILPLKCGKPSPREIQISKALNEPIPVEEIFNTHLEIVENIIENDGCCAARSEIDSILQKSKIYSSWIRRMPNLSKVNQINEYRQNPENISDWEALKSEIIENGMLIPNGQYLYSGGCFEENDMNVNELAFSTTLQPSVAWWHSCQFSKHISILKICDKHTKGFVMNRLNSTSQEKEILVAGKLKLIYIKCRNIGSFKVFEYELYSNYDKNNIDVKQ